jgi:hypothetical protein
LEEESSCFDESVLELVIWIKLEQVLETFKEMMQMF